MTPGGLRAYLDELRGAGARIAKVTLASGDGFEVQFALDESDLSAVTPAAPFVDKDGKPIDLDEGMPELARDPIEAANFKAK